MARLPPERYASVKTAWKLLVAALGGIEATVASTRATGPKISEYGAPGGPRFVPVDVVMEAEAIAGVPLVTAALARAQGYELVPVEMRGGGLLAVDLARIGRDVSDLFATAAGVLAGGPIRPRERERMLRDLEDLRRTAGETVALLHRESRDEAAREVRATLSAVPTRREA